MPCLYPKTITSNKTQAKKLKPKNQNQAQKLVYLCRRGFAMSLNLWRLLLLKKLPYGIH
jgi:DMSO/TMAO reductase YedYZ heme-binding membrane subunit